jgi:UDP-glucose 4-epimerase
MKQNVLITGGAGYIGSRLVDSLVAHNWRVVVVDNLATGKRENINPQATFYNVDISSTRIYSILKKEKPDCILHLAASKSVNDSVNNPVQFAQANILGSVNVINSAHKAGIKKILFTSTAGIYGDSQQKKKQSEDDVPNPSSPYAWTKLSIEEYLMYMNKHSNMNNIIVRFANVYGPGKESNYRSVVNIFIDRMLKKRVVIVHGDGNQTRDYVYIDDLVDICRKLVTHTSSKTCTPVYNVSTGREVSVKKLLNLISQRIGKEPKILYKPHIFVGQKSSILNASKIQKEFGLSVRTTLEEGIRMTIEYLKDNQEK